MNQSNVSNADLDAQIALMQRQIDLDVAAKWGVRVTLTRVSTSPSSVFNVFFKHGKSDVPGAGAYHTSGMNAYVFDGETNWQAEMDHEILEMLINPGCQIWGNPVMYDGVTGQFIYEVCDPVGGLHYNDNKLVDFIYPSWFIPNSPCPWDYLRLLPGPMKFSPYGLQLFRVLKSGNDYTYYQADDSGALTLQQ